MTPAEARTEDAISNAQRQLRDELDESLFLSAPWRRALDALDVERFDPSVAECRHNVGWVRRGGWRSGRLPRAAGIFRELGATSNGDGAGVMCDPTGEIRVIVHRELMESERARATSSTVDGDSTTLARARCDVNAFAGPGIARIPRRRVTRRRGARQESRRRRDAHREDASRTTR